MHTRLSLLSCALIVGLAVPAFAQEPASDDKVSGSVTVGVQNGTGIGDSSKLEQYETVPKGVSIFSADFDWSKGKRYLKFEGQMFAQDDQDASLVAGSKGGWKLHMRLNENPRWFSNTAETLYTQSSPGVFRLPDAMRLSQQRIWTPYTTETAAPANSSDNRFWSLRDYMSGAQPVDLRYVRKNGEIGFDFNLSDTITVKTSYQRDVRNGSQPVAFTFGPGINEVANPIQYTTQDTRAELEWAKNKSFVNAAFTYSDFHNAVPFTTVDNPVRLDNTDYAWTNFGAVNTAANATARLWNAPDNKAVSVDAAAGFQLPMNTRFVATITSTMMKNDFNFIPQATNPNLNLAKTDANYGKFSLTPEYSQFNGQLNQLLFNATLSSDPTPKFGWSFFVRTFDLKDKAPTYTFHSTVNSDGGASYSATGTSTDDESFNSMQYRVEAHFLPVTGVKFGINAGGTKTDYEERLFSDVKDTNIGVTFDTGMKQGMFHGAYSHISRTPGAINAGSGEATTALDPGAFMKDIAKQDSDVWNATITFTPMDNVAIALFGSGSKSTMPATTIGLKSNDIKSSGVDITLVPNDKVRASLGYVYETLNMDTNFVYSANGKYNVAYTNTIDNYANQLRDKVNTFKAGLKFELVPNKADVSTDIDYSKGTSDSGFTWTAGGTNLGGDLFFPTNTTTVNFPAIQYPSLPQVFNEMTIWKTYFNYHIQKNVTFTVLYWYQKFNQADFAYDGLAPYMAPGSSLYANSSTISTIYPTLDPSANRALFLGAGVPNFTANIVRASLTVRF